MPGREPRGWFMRRLFAALVIAVAIGMGGFGLAASLVLIYGLIGRTAAIAIVLVIGAAGAVVMWPLWSDLRQWARVPRLVICRRMLVTAIAQLPTTTDRDALADCIIGVCRMLLSERPLALLLPDAGNDRLVTAITAGPHASCLADITVSRHSQLARDLARDARPLLVQYPDRIAADDQQAASPSSYTAVPLVVRGDLVAVLALGRSSRGRMAGRDALQIASEIAGQAAGALENAELYGSLRDAFTELETAQRELLALQRATTAAQSSLDLQQVLRNIAAGLIEGMEYQEAIVFLIDPITRTITPASAAGRLLTPRLRTEARVGGSPLRCDAARPFTRSLLAREIRISDGAADSIVPYLIDHATEEHTQLLSDRTIVTVPLVANGDVVGGMVLLTQRRRIAEREVGSLRGFAGQAASAIVNARLYEDLRDAYNDLRIAQDELVRTQRLRSAGEIATEVAHDFNNILLAILTQSQLARREAAEPTAQRALAIIERAARDGTEVVQRIQNLARTKSPRATEPLDLNTIVRQSFEIAQPIWTAAAEARDARISATVELGPASRIIGAASELREVMVNLMLNAVQAMPDGGDLLVRTAVKDGHWWVEVTDSGVGMTDEVKRRIFEPFFTTKGAAGSGLGMSIVASIVQRHAGIIEVDSTPGNGTTIAIGFPLTLAGESRPETGLGRRVQMLEPLQILIVGQDARVAPEITSIIEQRGHVVRCTDSSQMALRILLEHDIAIVIADISGDSRAGLTVAQSVKRVRGAVEVMLLAGWEVGLDDDDPIHRCADHILTRPFSPDQVACVIDGVAGRQTGRQRSAIA